MALLRKGGHRAPRCLPPHVSTLSRVDLELKSHKTQVSFLAATSFQLHLSSLISILMGYSCRHSRTIPPCAVTRTCGNRIYRRTVCVYTCTHACARVHPARLRRGSSRILAAYHHDRRVSGSARSPSNVLRHYARLRPSSFYLFPQGWQILPLNGVAMGKRARDGKGGRAFETPG